MEQQFNDCRIITCCMHKIHRVREVPVLSADVTYPRWEILTDTDPAEEDVQRFNQGCRDICQAFLQWALGDPAAEAAQTFLANGQDAALRHCFARRELSLCLNICLPPFSADVPAPPKHKKYTTPAFCLHMQMTAGQRRREKQILLNETSWWDFPSLALI